MEKNESTEFPMHKHKTFHPIQKTFSDNSLQMRCIDIITTFIDDR